MVIKVMWVLVLARGVWKKVSRQGMMVAGLEEGQAAETEYGGSRAESESKLPRGSPQPNGPSVLPPWFGLTRGIHQSNYVIRKHYYEELILNENHLSPLNVFIIRTYFSSELLCPYTCS